MFPEAEVAFLPNDQVICDRDAEQATHVARGADDELLEGIEVDVATEISRQLEILGAKILYEAQVREAFQRKCCELDLDLLLVFCRALDEPNSGSAGHNEIFELMQPGRVDGVVILSSSLFK